MMESKHGIMAIAGRELRRMLSRPLYVMSMILAPLVCVVFFTTLMKDGLPQNLPIGVVDSDNTSTTRSILRNLDAFQQTEIVFEYSSFADARSAMQRGDIYGFFYIPDGTTAKAMRSEQPRISFYSNASYLVASSLAYKDMRMMAELASGAVGRTSLLARGATMDQAMAFLQPIKVDMRPLGNPWLNYSVYLSNTLLPAVLMLMAFLVTIFSIYTELKDETGKEWLEMASGNMYKAVAGKLLPQTLLFFLMIVFCQIWLYGFMGFPHNSGMPVMLVAGFMLVLASQAFAVFLCELIPSLRWCLSLATLWGVLSFPISGFSFPVTAMPASIRALSCLFPLRYYFLIYSDQALNGFPLSGTVPYYLALLAFMFLPFLFMGRLRYAMENYVYEP
ncbi:MAG: ABC transporter permease [Bacteroidaceae bacterium]|nr:ABC transporter permease [Bacteroidaceae bacterium]